MDDDEIHLDVYAVVNQHLIDVYPIVVQMPLIFYHSRTRYVSKKSFNMNVL